MLYCQRLTATITGVTVWCVGVDGHDGPCSWPTNIPPDGNLRTALPDGYAFRVDPTTGQVTLEQKRS